VPATQELWSDRPRIGCRAANPTTFSGIHQVGWAATAKQDSGNRRERSCRHGKL